MLEDDIITFVKNELKTIHKVLRQDYPEWAERQMEDEEVLAGEDEERRRSSRNAVLKITLDFLRGMKQEELADRLQSSKRIFLKIYARWKKKHLLMCQEIYKNVFKNLFVVEISGISSL